MTTQEIFKKVRQIEITTRGLVNQIFSGDYHSVFKGRGIEFSEVREYQYGDDIKAIDWNVTARLGHPFVKVFEEERELTLMLLVDMSASQFFGGKGRTKLEIATEVSAVLAFSALKNNDKVGCILFTDRVEKFIPPRKNRNHVLRIIREIIAFEPTHKQTNIGAALEFLNSTVKRRSIVFLISDFISSGYESTLKIAAGKHDLLTLVLHDKLELRFPAAGLVEFFDPESGKRRILDSDSKAFQRYFRDYADARKHQLNKLFSVSRIDAVWLNSPDDRDSFQYLSSLSRFFKQRAKRW